MSGQSDVERILGKRKPKGEVEYLIKWQDYLESENTWEQVPNLNCYEMICAFEVSEAPYTISNPVTDWSGPLEYVIKSKQDGNQKLVSAEKFDSEYPHSAIDYYEKMLFWGDDERVVMNV